MVTSAKKRGTPFEETEAGHLPDCNHTRIFDLRTMKRQFLFFCLHGCVLLSRELTTFAVKWLARWHTLRVHTTCCVLMVDWF